MKLKHLFCIGLSVAISFMCTQLRSNPPTDTEMEEQLKRIADEVPNGDLPVEVAARILKTIIEKTPEWAKTSLFNEALLACYYVDLTDDQLKCYNELSENELQEPLYCAIKDGFDRYNLATNKELKNFLLSDIHISEDYDYLNDAFFEDYEYWTYSMISWILKQRAKTGDMTAREALNAAIAILEKTLRRLDPVCLTNVLKKLLPLVDMNAPIVDTPLFQESLKIAFPQYF